MYTAAVARCPIVTFTSSFGLISHVMTRYREARRAYERIRQRLAGPVKVANEYNSQKLPGCHLSLRENHR